MDNTDKYAGHVLIGLGVAMVALLAFNPPDRWTAPYPMTELGDHALAYPGAASETIFALGLDPAGEARAGAALADAGHFAAYAEGPEGRTGLWTEAHSPDLARGYALAVCGAACRVLAERRPLHAIEPPSADTLILRPEMARRLGLRAPFTSGGNTLAIGGAGAWGTGHASGRGRTERSAILRAVAECEARRVAEATPGGIASPPCRYLHLNGIDLTDLRPEPPLYPAPYTVAHVRLVEIDPDDLHLVRGDGTPTLGLNPFRGPDALYGARASDGESLSHVIDQAGWPTAGDAMALALCEAGHRFGDPPCAVTRRRLPPDDLPDGTLGATPEMMAAYRAWEATGGAGAFAIGPLGAWGTSYGWDTLEEARQSAADWCAYHSRRSRGAYQLRRAFIDQPPCRIVAERRP